MKKWKASDMIFAQVWNNDAHEVGKNYTRRMLIYRTPDYQSYGDEYGGSDNGRETSVSLTINVEEGIVFINEYNQKLAANIFENEDEINRFVALGQERFDKEVDMGTDTSHFIFGYGGVMASLYEYTNENIDYIRLVFPDNEKFQNPRYREKVEWSLIKKGAIIISNPKNEKYLAVIQRKHKPRDLNPFKPFLPNQQHQHDQSDQVSISLPKWLGAKLDVSSQESRITIQTAIERETEKAVFVRYNNKSSWLPKSKIDIQRVG